MRIRVYTLDLESVGGPDGETRMLFLTSCTRAVNIVREKSISSVRLDLTGQELTGFTGSADLRATARSMTYALPLTKLTQAGQDMQARTDR